MWADQNRQLFLESLDGKMPPNGSTGGQMAIYTLKDIPDDVWREARKKAIDKKTTMKDLIIQLLREWIKKK
jgi:hypothetical protein